MKLQVILLFCGAFSIHAQQADKAKEAKNHDGFTVLDCFKNPAYSRRLQADSVKANNILKGTRTWRLISLENGENGLVFNSNNSCVEIGLFEIIKFGLLEKQLIAFSSDDFNRAAVSRLNYPQLIERLTLRDSSETIIFDADGNGSPGKMKTSRYLSGNDIKGYLLKEDWIVNAQTGTTEKYIVGLVPLVYDPQLEKITVLFWLYYPEWEELLGMFEARNFYSYARISFRQVFERKYFVSRISRESNMFERGVRAYMHGEDAYLESERIKEKLLNSEQDLFQH